MTRFTNTLVAILAAVAFGIFLHVLVMDVLKDNAIQRSTTILLTS